MAGAGSGVLTGGLPYRVVGHGPPVVVLPGLTGDNADPTGRDRRAHLRPFIPLTRYFTVYLVNRRPGLKPAASLRDLADDYADAVHRHFAERVDVIGVSTGGSIAQLFAADHPDLVRRLVLVCSAFRLSEYGRQTQRRLARLTAAGQPRRAWAATGPALAATATGGVLLTALMWLFGTRMNPPDPTDLLTTIDAEDAFDATTELPRITVPTLVVAGDRDRFYGPALFRRTAEVIPDARLRLYPGKGHVGVMAHRPAIREIQCFLTADDPHRCDGRRPPSA
jgi:pimeloyl-ACP methyl ester carboxylesterase